MVVSWSLIVLMIPQVGPLDRRPEVGLVTKRFALKKLGEDNPIAFHGEAGYQAELLMPGLRFKLWPIFAVKKFPWVQVPAGEIGVVIAQVGAPLPIGAKSARLPARVRQLLRPRARSSTQRRPEGRAAPGAASGHARADPPGRVPRAHVAAGLRPAGVARLVAARRRRGGALTPGVVRAHARAAAGRRDRAARARTTSSASSPRSRASRCRRATSPAASAASTTSPRWSEPTDDAPTPRSSRCCSGSKNDLHNNYQDFQAFLDAGGKHRPAARPAALRRVPAEPVPRAASSWCRCSS